MKSFVHLHTHTERGSMFDGCCKVSQLFRKVQINQMKAIAVTDHHNVSSWFQLPKYAKKYNIKPIYGIELNIGSHHMTALAKDEEGLKNIILLNNLGYANKGKVRVTEVDLRKHNEGIIFLSGCSKGKLSTLLSDKKFQESLKVIDEYKELLKERFYIEIHHNKTDHSDRVNQVMRKIGERKKIDIVPTNDCHFLDKEDFEFHKKVVSMQTGGKIIPKTSEHFVKTYEEMNELFPKEELHNTKKIADKCKVDFEDFIGNQMGNKKLAIGMFYFYNDAEAIRKSFYYSKKYSLGEFMYQKVKRKEMTLEDLYQEEDIKEEVKFAFGLRHKLYKVEPDPYRYILVNDHFPIYKKNKKQPPCTQAGLHTLEHYEIPILDTRKTSIYLNK